MITIKECYKYGIQTYTIEEDAAIELTGQSSLKVGQDFVYDGSRFIILDVQKN
jgi:hypothetical protein